MSKGFIDTMKWYPLDLFRPNQLKRIKEKLTLTHFNEYGNTTTSITGWKINRLKGLFGVPRSYNSYLLPKIEFVDQTTLPKADLEFRGSLRQNQVPIMDRFMSNFTGYGGILCAFTGFGKTACSMWLLSKLKTKALIIVHQSNLVDQWKQSAKTFLGEDIGIVKQDKCDFKDRNISVAMIQSLMSRDYGQEFLNNWGVIIYDECHHLSAEVFNTITHLFPARYRVGCSATVNRKDGLEDAFFWHIGPILAKTQNPDIKAQVHPRRTGVSLPKYHLSRWDGKPNLAKAMTKLIAVKQRNDQIVEEIIKAYKAGRKILVLSSRIDHLIYLKESLDKKIPEKDSGYYCGQVPYRDDNGDIKRRPQKKAEQEEVKNKPIMLAIEKIAREGFDRPDLDVAMFVTPMGDITQPAGRILRQHEGKKTPIIIDYVDENAIFKNMYKKRCRYYRKLKFDIIDPYLGRVTGNG